VKGGVLCDWLTWKEGYCVEQYINTQYIKEMWGNYT